MSSDGKAQDAGIHKAEASELMEDQVAQSL